MPERRVLARPRGVASRVLAPPLLLSLLPLLAAPACTTPKRAVTEAFGRASNVPEATSEALPAGARRVADPEEIPALDAPAFVAPATLAAPLAPDDEVAGLVAPSGAALAIPLSVLARTPIVNLLLDGVPVSVVLDAASGAVAAWVSSREGSGATGLVVDESFVVHDRGTLAMSVSLTGRPVGGQGGAALVAYPVDVLPWSWWSALHAASSVADAPGDPALLARIRGGVASDAAPDGVPAAAWVVGVVAGGVAQAFRVSSLGPLVHAEVGGEPLVLVAVPGGALVRVARASNDVLRFTPEPSRLVDGAGGAWTFDGRCLSGPRLGEALPRATLDRRVRWGAWKAAFPASGVQ